MKTYKLAFLLVLGVAPAAATLAVAAEENPTDAAVKRYNKRAEKAGDKMSDEMKKARDTVNHKEKEMKEKHHANKAKKANKKAVDADKKVLEDKVHKP